jgi:hypothetical protein
MPQCHLSVVNCRSTTETLGFKTIAVATPPPFGQSHPLMGFCFDSTSPSRLYMVHSAIGPLRSSSRLLEIRRRPEIPPRHRASKPLR